MAHLEPVSWRRQSWRLLASTAENPMTTRSATARLLALLPIVAVVFVVWTTFGSTRAAAGPSPHMNSGLVGLTFGQMVRFNITNGGEIRGMIIDGCRFVDADGRVVKETTGRRVLAPGQSLSCDLDRAEIVDRSGRVEVNAVISLGARSDDLVVTTEVVNVASGETLVGWAR